jgi:hypothetical protein
VALTSTDIAAEIADLGPSGGVVTLPPEDITFTSGVTVPRNVTVRGAGPNTCLVHEGSGAALRCRDGDPFAGWARRSVTDLRVILTDASQVGIDVGNQYGFHLRDVAIDDLGTGAAGLLMLNSTYWTEGCDLERVNFRCKTGIVMGRQGGTDSFGYQRWRSVSFNVPAGGVGVDIGGPYGQAVYLYNSDLDCAFWLEGPGAKAVRVRSSVNAVHNRLFLTGETNTAGRTGVVKDAGATFAGYGVIDIQGAPSNVSSSSTLLVR